jgi:glycogen debranching enzyme
MSSVRLQARAVLARNRRRGVSRWEGRRYDFVCPSTASYPFQWFWDSCFHAVALTRVDVRLAELELEGLFQGQRADGFMPHMILWEREAYEAVLATYNVSFGGRYITATIQPPVLGLAIERVYRAGRNRAFLERALQVLGPYHDWLAAKRDPDGAGLIAILQPDESGMDACPKYDRALGLETVDDPGLRRAMQRLIGCYDGLWHDPTALLAREAFVWIDCLVNACYLQGLSAEARLLTELGATERAARLRARRARALAALLDRCWDERTGAFFDYYYSAGLRQPVRVLTISSLLPLILDDLPPALAARLVDEHLANPEQFWLPYPLPSVAASEPSFEPDYRSGLIWRGPTWLNTNWLLIDGLRTHGFDALADELAARSLAMVARGGIREFFNPLTAEGLGARGFGWTTLALDLTAV